MISRVLMQLLSHPYIFRLEKRLIHIRLEGLTVPLFCCKYKFYFIFVLSWLSIFLDEIGFSQIQIHVSGVRGDWRNFRHIRTQILSVASIQGWGCVWVRWRVAVIRYHASDWLLVTCCLKRSMSNLCGLGSISDMNCDNLNLCISKMHTHTHMPNTGCQSRVFNILVGRWNIKMHVKTCHVCNYS